MIYSEIKNFMQDADLITVHGKWMMSRAIQWYTGQDVSHVGLLVWASFDYTSDRVLCLIEAMEGFNVRLLPMDHVVKEYGKNGGKLYWHRLSSPEMDRQKIIEFAMQKWGSLYANHYQFLLAISPKLQGVRRYLGRQMDTDTDRYHCSELVTRAYKSQGYKHDKEPAFTTPGDCSAFNCLADRVELESGESVSGS